MFLAKALQRSPLMAKRTVSDSYGLIEENETEPLALGVAFRGECMNRMNLPAELGRGDKHSKAIADSLYRHARAPFRQYSILVRDLSVRLQDVSDRSAVEEIPASLISECAFYGRVLCLVHMDAETTEMRAHLFKMANMSAARAVVQLVNSEFSVLFAAWQAKKDEEKRRSLAADRDSPRARGILTEHKSTSNPAGTKKDSYSDAVTPQVFSTSSILTTGKLDENDDTDNGFTALAISRSNVDLGEG